MSTAVSVSVSVSVKNNYEVDSGWIIGKKLFRGDPVIFLTHTEQIQTFSDSTKLMTFCDKSSSATYVAEHQTLEWEILGSIPTKILVSD